MRWIVPVAAALAIAGPTRAADLKHGKAVFVQCAACHSFDPASNGLGPNLIGIVGRKAASVESYVYSPPMRRSSITWTKPKLDAFLADPQGVVRGTKMPFAGLAASNDRADLIAYLATR